MMFFMFKKREAEIERQEQDIDDAKKVLHKKMNRDLKKQNELIDILSNGITLEIKKGMGGHHV